MRYDDFHPEPYEALEETWLNQKTRFVNIKLMVYRLKYFNFQRLTRSSIKILIIVSNHRSLDGKSNIFKSHALDSIRSKGLTWDHRVNSTYNTFESFVTPKLISLNLRYSHVLAETLS